MIRALQLWQSIRGRLETLSWLAALLTRVTIGQVFIESGWGKVHDIPKVTALFSELGIPMPHAQAILASVTELGCGGLILLGLGTRLASVPLVIVMIVAILTARIGDLHGFSDLTGFIEYLYIVLLGWLIVNGAGCASLDEWLARKYPAPRSG